MKFTVLSRNDAIKYSKDIKNDCIIISISDCNECIPKELENNFHNSKGRIKGLLTLFFDDVEAPDKDAMNIEHAKNIIEFVNKYVDEINEIIVHCGAGISRSAGVAAGLMKIINGNDFEIFNNGKFCPNATCYKNILTCYYGSYNEKEIEEKFKGNIERWLREQDLE